MHPALGTQSGFETAPSLTGTFEVSLTRAVLPFRDGADGSPPGGRIQDVGLGVVVDGSDPVRADVIDLGSAELRVVDLTGPLVVMGWLYPSGLRTVCRVVADAQASGVERARAFTFNMALRALRAAGFGPLTRPTILRIGFRDLCQDLDLHEGTAVRLLLPTGGVVRAHLDYESATLVARTGRSTPNAELEEALAAAFPERELYRGPLSDALGAQAYHIPLSIPRTLAESRDLLAELRQGVIALLDRFESERLRSLRELTGTFGERDSLRTLSDRPDLPRLEKVDSGTERGPASALEVVH